MTKELSKCPRCFGLPTSYFQVLALLLLITAISDTMGRSEQELLEQGRELQRRFAETGEEFEGHDIAVISHVEGRGRFRRSSNLDIANRLFEGGDRNIRLDLHSGRSLDMTLRHVPHINAETEIVHNTHGGRVKRSVSGSDLCLASGTVDRGGIAALSFCDGLFGMVSVDGFDYLVHPVEGRRLKRDLDHDNDDDDVVDDKVHVMWRRSTPGIVDGIEVHSMSKRDLYDQVNISKVTELVNTTDLVIELGLFSDAEYCKIIRKIYPDQRRVDAFLLARVAAVQAIFGDRRKVGYDVKFKVKLLEYWDVNPEEYVFEQSLGSNLKSFCEYTRDPYPYDLRGLNTGVTQQGGPAIGVAYLASACTKIGCFNCLSAGFNSFLIYAHEIGHTLSMRHPWTPSYGCPQELRSIRGFMGNPPDFSPCNKWELNRYLESGKGSCFFVEDRESNTPPEYQDLMSGFNGQTMSPDQLCDLQSGPDYVYYPIGPRTGQQVCRRWLCLNANESNSNFGKLEAKPLPFGFPCGNHMYCGFKSACIPLETPGIGWDVEYLRAHEGISQWSEWSEGWTSCSRSCGTGVELRTRVCKKSALNLQPYCEGHDFLPRLCNRQNCPDDPSDAKSLIQARADEVCSRLVASGREFSGYLPKALVLDLWGKLPDFPSKSCLLTCTRSDGKPTRIFPKAILPDGAFCTNSLTRAASDVDRFGIELRCVRGRCLEFSGCPAGGEKDSCGICNGGDRRCVTVNIDSSYDVDRGQRALLAVIPAGARYIEAKMKWGSNPWVNLELWSKNGKNIIGRGAIHTREVYVGNDAVDHAGASWSYKRRASFLRSAGPTNETVEIRAHKGYTNPVKDITIRYAAPEV